MLTLPLKSKWYHLIKDGTKKEEYRDITPYYCVRLCAKYNPSNFECRHCATALCQPTPKVHSIDFTLGYPLAGDNERHLLRYVLSIEKGHGQPHLGADPKKKQFIVKLF